MKVLLVHSHYRSNSPSGELQVFHAELQLLRSRGIEVDTFEVYSDKFMRLGPFAKVLAFFLIPWNPFMAWAMSKKIAQFRPDVIHVHNFFPWLSPAIFFAAKHHAVSVLTLHNYRLFCPAGIPMRDGRPCVECIDQRSVWPAIRHRCYRKSRFATIPVAISVALHRALDTWSRRVDAFVALTDFQKELVIKAGLPAKKIYVKPNFINSSPIAKPWAKRTGNIIFVGRLSSEKGVNTLIEAWRFWGEDAPNLDIVGSGDLDDSLVRSSVGLNVKYWGALGNDQVRSLIANARMLIVPSECFEGLSLVLLEAFSVGTPVAVSDIGPLPLIIQDGVNGVVFRPRDPQSLYQVVSQAWQQQDLLIRLGVGARRSFKELYSEESNFTQLIAIYRNAIESARCG